jgi:hypothetical protein
MKSGFVTALALGLALAGTSIAPAAYAEQAAATFRQPAAQTFTAADLERYGLDKAAAQRGEQLQKEGYEVKVLSKEEAAKYQAGITDNQWIWLGILAGVIIIAVAVAD